MRERPIVNVGDIVTMKKSHPCGSFKFKILRIGADFRLKCLKCDHEIMTPRHKIERFIKKVEQESEG